MTQKGMILIAAIIVVLLSYSMVMAEDPGTYKLEGTAFFYYMHDASEGDGQTNKFAFSRLYFGGKYYLSDKFTIRYLTDVKPGDWSQNLYAKYAYLDWMMRDNLHLVLGMQGTNNWNAPEKAWGYRVIRYSPMESFGDYMGEWRNLYISAFYDWWISIIITDPIKAAEVENLRDNFSEGTESKMGSSADLGVGFTFKPCPYGYINFMVRNGGGYRFGAGDDDMYKNFQIRIGRFLLNRAVHISAFAEVEPWKGVDIDGNPESYMNYQWDVMASYTKENWLTVGVDVNSKVFQTSMDDITAMCYSGFTHFNIMPGKLKGIARYDFYDTGFDDVETLQEVAEYETNASLMIIGVDWQVHEHVSIIPNFQILSYKDADLDAVNTAYVHLLFTL